MIPEELVRQTFVDLADKYGLIIDHTSKMKFNIYSIEDLPFSLKEEINSRVKTITQCIGRKRWEVDNPVVYKNGDNTICIRGGIWSIRIY